MKTNLKLSFLFISLLILSACGNSEKEEKQQIKLGEPAKKETPKTDQATSSKDMIDMSNKGIGPIKSVTLNAEIDQVMAAKGQSVFKNMCTACHKTDKKFIGPAMAGITARRSPEWILNMILNPEEMIQKDPIAKQLLIESNMAVMANQNLTEEEAKSILEYFRQIDNK